MENQTNTGSLETLIPGQTLILNARKVKGNKIQLEFAERLSTPDSPQSLLSAFNKSDNRFSQSSGVRRAWLTSEPSDASELLNVDLVNAKYIVNEDGREVHALNILNPTMDGQRMRVQIVETTTPTEWQTDNLERAAKRKGADGEFITHKGQYIFSNGDVVLGEPKHTFLEADTVSAVSTSGIYANVNVETGEIAS